MYMAKRTLKGILVAIAKDKGIKNPRKWAEERLDKCEVKTSVSSGEAPFLKLRSHKHLSFGVKDSEFVCRPFILYREMENTEDTKSFKEYEVYIFQQLFKEDILQLLKDSYQYHFDTVKDLRVYYDLQPIFMRIKTPTGFVALGEYSELEEDDFDIQTSLYSLNIKGSNLYVYSLYKEGLNIYLLDLKEYNSVVKETETHSYGHSDMVTVKRMGELVPYWVVRDKRTGECSVEWLDKDKD